MKNNFFNSVINRGFNGGRTGVGAPVTDTCSSHGLIGSISVVETTVKHQSLSFRRVAMLLFVILLSIGNMWGTIVTYSFSATEIKAGTTKGTVTVSMKGCTDKTGDPQQICKDGSTKVKEGVIQIANTAGTSWDDKCVVISSTSVIESFNVHGAPNTDASKKYAVIGWKGTPSATFDGKTTLTLPSRANACSDAYSGEITPLDADSKKTIKNVRIYRQVKVSATKFEGSSTLGDGQTGQIADISVTVNEIPTSCTVTFYKNDGTDATATQTNITPSTPTSLRTLSDIDWSRTGYDFDGWAESASGDAVYEDGGSITLTSNKDLYAHWTAKTYDITLDANGGAADGSATVVYDGGVTSYTPATPAGEGQTLLGYFSATTGGN
ncbi:MAG: InlB B-repeat-containing protein, partial [Paludibacteraceae bacterium]|nr:InlB B-repeat-containing protein [Paludibacteraceae bacterium]